VATSRVLVVGEALIDIVDGSEIVGGSPANVALGLGRLGVDVTLLTALGRDERGVRIAGHLRAAGVGVRHESFVLERTSTARATVQPDGSAEYEFDIEWTVPEIAVRDFDMVHVGSVACFMEPGASQVVATIQRAAAHGAFVTFDPNIRAALVDQAVAAERFGAIAGLSTVVKLSDEDAAAIYPGLPIDEVASRILESGPRVVAITRGGAGALVYTPDARIEVAAPPTVVVDTVGAGDTFMAALVASIVDRPDLDFTRTELANLGAFCAAAAAITVSRAGADLPTRDEVAAFVSDPRGS
jgi:fructokinase